MKIYSLSQGLATHYLGDLDAAKSRAQAGSIGHNPVVLREHHARAGTKQEILIAALNGEAFSKTVLIDVYRDGTAVPPEERITAADPSLRRRPQE
jgi:hypothetical protein